MAKAGLFSGEVVESAPANGAATTKQNGYQWMQWGGETPPPYEPNGTYFDEGDEWALTGGPVVGGAGQKAISLVMAFRIPAAAAGNQNTQPFELIATNIAKHINLEMNFELVIDGEITIVQMGVGGILFGNIVATEAYDTWHTVLFSRASNGLCVAYFDNDDRTSLLTQNTADMASTTADTYRYGWSNVSANKNFQGCLSYFGFSHIDLDFANPANRAKFFTPTNEWVPVDTDTWDAWGGVQPKIWLEVGDPDINEGSLDTSAGGMTVGTLSPCSDPP